MDNCRWPSSLDGDSMESVWKSETILANKRVKCLRLYGIEINSNTTSEPNWKLTHYVGEIIWPYTWAKRLNLSSSSTNSGNRIRIKSSREFTVLAWYHQWVATTNGNDSLVQPPQTHYWLGIGQATKSSFLSIKLPVACYKSQDQKVKSLC